MKARIHWNTQKKMWTVHTYKGCEWGHYIRVFGEWTTELKPQNKSNPRGFVVCDRTQILIMQELTLDVPPGSEKLIYDKHEVQFNHIDGCRLLVTPEGAFIPPESWDDQLTYTFQETP